MKRDIRYILKRVIIGILIGVFFMLFKNNISFAATIDNATAYAYMESQKCQKNDNVFSCQDGLNYKFTWTPNNANNTSDFSIMFLQNDENNYQLIKNLIISYEFSTPITINSTNRSIRIMMGNGSYVYANSNDNFQFVLNLISGNTYDSSDNIDYRYKPLSSYSFKPYYCTYLDSNDNLNKCGVILEKSGTDFYNFYMVLDIPLNSVVKRVNLYLGDYIKYSSFTSSNLFTSLTPVYVPYGNLWVHQDTATYTSMFNLYKVQYSTYRTRENVHNSTNSNANMGLYMFQPNRIVSTPKFNIPNNSNELTIVSNDYTSNSYKYYFTNYSSDLSNQLDNSIANIEDSLVIQNNPDEDDSPINDNLEIITDDFNSAYANNFTSLFSSLFAYPLYKIQQQTEIDLVRDNINGTPILNSLICMRNSAIDNMLDTYVPYEIVFYRNYSFNLPCPHTEIYNKLKYGNYGFYGNYFKGASLNVGITYSFADIWLTLQHGILVYLLFVNVLNIYKYILDSNKSEIEVLEL